MGFGLIIGFIEHLQIELQVTIALSLIHTLCSSLQDVLNPFSLLYRHRMPPGNGFQRRTFLLLRVPELSPCLSYQLLTATAHNGWTAVLWLTQQPTHSTKITAPTELSELLYDWRFTANQFVLATSLLRSKSGDSGILIKLKTFWTLCTALLFY
jgi:hypothetical protein